MWYAMTMRIPSQTRNYPPITTFYLMVFMIPLVSIISYCHNMNIIRPYSNYLQLLSSCGDSITPSPISLKMIISLDKVRIKDSRDLRTKSIVYHSLSPLYYQPKTRLVNYSSTGNCLIKDDNHIKVPLHSTPYYRKIDKNHLSLRPSQRSYSSTRTNLVYNTNINTESLNSETLKPLPYKLLSYNSVEINTSNIYVDDISQFGVQLWVTISELKQLKKDCVYVKISIENSHLIPVAGNYGFQFHHAEGNEACLMLWLANTPCRVPPYATHHCGVGAVIIDNNQNILVIKEKSKLVGWKLPGGYVNVGEEFGDAAIREVYEETGIQTKFIEILTVRHSHNIQFGRSDVYVICRLEALSSDIRIDDEIEDAKWISVDKYLEGLKHPMLQIAIEMVKNRQKGLQEITLPSAIPGRLPYKLYVPTSTTK